MNTNITILDATGQAFFLRQLEYIKARSYDVQYQDLVARELFPVSNEAPEGTQTITYRTYDMVGSARIIMNYANDLPRADIAGKETTIKVRGIGISYGYSRDDILAAQMTGLPLDQRRANAAMYAWEQKVDDIAFNGDAASGLIGFFTDPNIPALIANTGNWISATPDDIIDDINRAVGNVRTTTRMKETPQTLLIPVDIFNRISGTPRAPQSDTTILEFVKQKVNGITDIRPVNELEGTKADSAYLYDRNPDKLQLEIPKELEYLPPQEKGLELLVPGWGKTGGVNVYYPMSALEITGV